VELLDLWKTANKLAHMLQKLVVVEWQILSDWPTGHFFDKLLVVYALYSAMIKLST